MAVALSSCASDPATIDASLIPPSTFAGRDCASIATDIAAIEPHLTEIAVAQRKRRTADVVSGMIVGITPTMLNGKGEREAEISRLKGELAGLREAGAAQGCSLPPEDPALVAALTPPPKQDAGTGGRR